MSDAKKIRQALKQELNLNNRQVSVVDRSGSTYGSVRIRIKDESVDVQAIKALALRFEQIDRCAYSGEILGGGNSYVTVTKNGVLV
jgi:hypothetical protein